MQSTAHPSPTALRAIVPRGLHWGVALAFIVLGIAGLIVVIAPSQADVAGPLGVLTGIGAVGVLLTRSSQHMEGRDRFAWRWIGVGYLAVAAGILTIAVLDALFGPLPAFGPPDSIVIAGYVLILSGFGSLPHLSTSSAQRARIYLDSLIGAISVAVVMWVLALDDLIQAFARANAWERWAGSAYPILDVAALMVVVIVTVRRSSYRFDLRLMLLALGIVVQSIADLTFLRSGIGSTFEEANPNYLLFLFAAALYLAAATIVHRQPKVRAYADRKASLMSMLAPYAAAALLIGLLIVEIGAAELTADAQVLLHATLLVGVLVIFRQSVAIHENRILVERQRADLVSSISHELRTPLTAIVGFLDVMADADAGLGEGERQELTDLIHQEARHMSRIVSDLVLLARGTPDQLTLKEEVIPADDVVTRAISSVENKTTELTVDIEPGLRVKVDSGRVQQVLVNLITNAIRYGNGRGTVVIRREGDDLAIEVHDNGPGVPKKYELVIWEQFERGPNRFNAAVPGSGIGLAVVDAITRAHDGTNQYRTSERLGGACFRIVLPDRVIAA